MFQGVVIYGHFTARREMDILSGLNPDCLAGKGTTVSNGVLGINNQGIISFKM